MASNSALHHRRPPAHHSVSLRHSPRARLIRPVPGSDSASDGSQMSLNSLSGNATSSNSPSTLQPLPRDSSGESSCADRWFDKSNNEVSEKNISFADNDPPFFLRNSSPPETPLDAREQMDESLTHPDIAESLLRRAEFLYLDTDGGSNDDFRSVIDDLTVQNKKLKRRLKKYEKLHDSHLEDEKLFEVRVHRLPAEKKRELEENLRSFASSLSNQSGAHYPPKFCKGLMPATLMPKTASSQGFAQHADSAYASMSVSAQGSSSAKDGRSKALAQTAPSKQQNIQSYLHHIPENLVPHLDLATMTERAKMMLVVHKLEQIFAGKGAAASANLHSPQPREVSQVAAKADRTAIEAQGHHARTEGVREAHIMLEDTEEALSREKFDSPPDENSLPSVPEDVDANGSSERSPSRDSFHQRPTRTQDLDPQRAQLPSENMQYMRHLGFSPPQWDPSNPQEEGHGWIYLNLLINMAQLHTINVTTDFVRNALGEYSSKFEVSSDGHKVRWKGGHSFTRTSSTGGDPLSLGSSREIAPCDERPRKRMKMSHEDSARSVARKALQHRISVQRTDTVGSKLFYTPFFSHNDSSDDDDASSSEEENGSMASPFEATAPENVSGMTSSGIRMGTLPRRAKRRDGPIIFYNNARFCTDLSGDRDDAPINYNAPLYKTATDLPIGKSHPAITEEAFERRGYLAEAYESPEPMNNDRNPIPAQMELSFPLQSPLVADLVVTKEPILLEVSGIGGVRPADNFTINVESHYASLDKDVMHRVPSQVAPAKYPTRIAETLKGPNSTRMISSASHKLVMSTAKPKDLPPSELPPALMYMHFNEEYVSDDESDVEDTMSGIIEELSAFPLSTATQAIDNAYLVDTDSEQEDEDDSDIESDGSLDLLATARELDPETVLAREREYDANMAERLADEIPAGSSAATAGGGSGLESPASDASDMSHIASRESTSQTPFSKMARTSDSMVVYDFSVDEEDFD